MPVKDSHTRIKPLPLASGCGCHQLYNRHVRTDTCVRCVITGIRVHLLHATCVTGIFVTRSAKIDTKGRVSNFSPPPPPSPPPPRPPATPANFPSPGGRGGAGARGRGGAGAEGGENLPLHPRSPPP